MRLRQGQGGVVLILVMLFLVLITMFSISAFRSSTTNLLATRSMMIRQEAQSAAQWAIEDTISNGAFETTAAPAPITKNVTGDGGNNYTANLTIPTCKKIRYLKVKELPRDPNTGLAAAAWITCDAGGAGRPSGGATGGGFIEGAASAPLSSSIPSYCAEAVWDIQANVQDSKTNSQVEVHQEVAVPHPVDKIDAVCNRS